MLGLRIEGTGWYLPGNYAISWGWNTNGFMMRKGLAESTGSPNVSPLLPQGRGY